MGAMPRTGGFGDGPYQSLAVIEMPQGEQFTNFFRGLRQQIATGTNNIYVSRATINDHP